MVNEPLGELSIDLQVIYQAVYFSTHPLGPLWISVPIRTLMSIRYAQSANTCCAVLQIPAEVPVRNIFIYNLRKCFRHLSDTSCASCVFKLCILINV